MSTSYSELVRAYALMDSGQYESRDDVGRYMQLSLSDYQRDTGVDETEAERAIVSLLNHVVQLVKEPWFAVPSIQERAVNETIQWMLGSKSVPSAHAQTLWERWWALKLEDIPAWMSDLNSTTEGERAMAHEFWIMERTDAEDKWRAAWQAWLDN